MKEFKGKTAVISGAANGFGAEFAKESARRGMRLVLADIDKENLDNIMKTVTDLGAPAAVAVCADLSQPEGVKEMLDKAISEFGAIDLLINNAGIYYINTFWETPWRDVQWMVDVNLMGYLYAMHEAIPIMLKQDTPGHILNVGSVAGLMTAKEMVPYHATKHAVVAASESVKMDLDAAGAKIGVSVYCPGFVQTDLYNFNRHRPERFQSDDPYYQSPAFQTVLGKVKHVIETGQPIDKVAATVFAAIEKDDFYILTHPEINPFIKKRGENILNNGIPGRD